MAKVYAMIADGSEEVECLAVLDILKRGGVEVLLVSIKRTREIVSSHQVKITADAIMEETDFSDGDLIFVPGGLPGAEYMSQCTPLIEQLHTFKDAGKRIAAICAAPGLVLGRHGLLEGKTATCFPGYEEELKGAVHTSKGVVTDGNVTTARGLGFAIDLGLELVRLLVSEEVSADVKKKIQYS